MTAPERCPTCDRDECDRASVAAVGGPVPACARHAVDWRARALAAEARIATVAAAIEHDIAVKLSHDSARSSGGQTVGTGGPLTGAPQSVLRYLDRAVMSLHDERTRAIASDAAKWRAVAPLIEALRDAYEGASEDRLDAALAELLAAVEVKP